MEPLRTGAGAGRGTRNPAAVAALTAVIAITAAGCSATPVTGAAAPPPSAAGNAVEIPLAVSNGAAEAQVVTPAVRQAAAPRDVAKPVRLRVPAIGVNTGVIGLKLDRSGRLVAPKRFDNVGWNVAGPEPGEPGVAVIAGHVDSRTGPAVFYRLRQLKKGDTIRVERADGSAVTFKVQRLARYPKNRIPNAQVYGRSSKPELRLITCGGTFDRSRGSYRDNIVVYAAQAKEVR
ncbi:class F sortase [Microtetraspora sp. NBRC 13810]|uniref:class F sortase n=1 Tax=Microtetraspora sp. NBRC 13810 TaxID=3030990 RepID=UPI0024A3A9AC|nr:class F sortase [Microtetraspora sp. NBRC 13810]GLW07581.1 class F sortase [Microtetraspora sp. NBRC 13810]